MEETVAKIKNYFDSVCFLSSLSSEEFLKVISIKNIEKGKTFVKKDTPSNKEFIVLDGVCRSFISDQNGDEITLSFFTANNAISPSLVRSNEGNAILNIQAITDVEVATFENTDLMSMMTGNQEIRAWGNRILQQELINKVDKEISQISMAAKERLIHFRDQYPSLENLIQHGFIASYLGITTVSLSRLRKELMGS